ncbi:hypothetical protein [Lactobacillus sp.]|uniref:hypothetical protein n=1 Tax=Lactobacillus sp. TaxID=1591 RepID=UPI0019CA0F55|nr:hypothetical protein [Lactobacillus sp.]MBD5430506.1 hypothetical protein [Lactobacillus sp.]
MDEIYVVSDVDESELESTPKDATSKKNKKQEKKEKKVFAPLKGNVEKKQNSYELTQLPQAGSNDTDSVNLTLTGISLIFTVIIFIIAHFKMGTNNE